MAAQNNVNQLSSALREAGERRIQSERIVGVVVAIGAMLLESGAEVYRVEETMNRLGKAVPGVDDCISYVTVTGIMCSIISKGETVTRIARIGSGSRNIAVINAINNLSRQAEKKHYGAAYLEQELEKIKALPKYSLTQKTFFAAIGAAGFAVFFNGDWKEIAGSFLIGLAVQLLYNYLSNLTLNMFFANALSAFATAVLSFLFHRFVPLASINILIISVIMLLVPGLALTNALRDTMMGEYLSGVARTTEAMLIAVSIALGVGLGLYACTFI
ncbi:MAG: threonine/serine exporter family protein [Ileibacterium sp.]|nr:threonine/serine exporter family protein [Ileibacterium sp.]